MEYVKPFVIGLVFLFLAMFQQTNTMFRRWVAAFFTSLLVSACIYMQVNYASKDPVAYIVFSLGAAFGSSLGILFGHHYGKG